MASPTQWTWVWVNSRSWRWTGRPGVQQSMRSQRVWHDWVTELNCTSYCYLKESHLIAHRQGKAVVTKMPDYMTAVCSLKWHRLGREESISNRASCVSTRRGAGPQTQVYSVAARPERTAVGDSSSSMPPSPQLDAVNRCGLPQAPGLRGPQGAEASSQEEGCQQGNRAGGQGGVPIGQGAHSYPPTAPTRDWQVYPRVWMPQMVGSEAYDNIWSSLGKSNINIYEAAKL